MKVSNNTTLQTENESHMIDWAGSMMHKNCVYKSAQDEGFPYETTEYFNAFMNKTPGPLQISLGKRKNRFV